MEKNVEENTSQDNICEKNDTINEEQRENEEKEKCVNEQPSIDQPLNISENDTKNDQSKLSAVDSIKLNYKSWLLIFIAIYIISYPNISFGYISFFVIMFLAYLIHLMSHKFNTIFTSTHQYHHHHNNLFSHFIQVCVEIACAGSVLLIYNFTGFTMFEPWILIFSNIFYSSIHNINYAIFHVNNVHTLHHVYENTNIGPDIFDVLFGTKNRLNTDVENTNHYIPNIIISTIIVMLAKFYYMKSDNKHRLYSILNAFIHIILVIVAVSSIVIWNNGLNGPKPEKSMYIQSQEFMDNVKTYFNNLFK